MVKLPITCLQVKQRAKGMTNHHQLKTGLIAITTLYEKRRSISIWNKCFFPSFFAM